MSKILVACAVGVNTSEIIASKLRDIFDEEGISATIETSKINDVSGMQDEFDVIVSLADIEGINKPLVNGVGLLTGINAEEIVNKIKEYL